MLQGNQQKSSMSTIEKTLLTANLFDGFWDRWIAHGVNVDDLKIIRTSISTKEQWLECWEQIAYNKLKEAEQLEEDNRVSEAELVFRTASLYYQLNQWLIPENSEEKLYWLNKSIEAIQKADQIGVFETSYDLLRVDENEYFGRIRRPLKPKGVVIIITPLDSAKEELFTYELDFLNRGFVTVSFDGPGQGQTYTQRGELGSKKRWKEFIDRLIDTIYNRFQELPIHLFGTSSGATWSLYGSCNPLVEKTVAVSPAFRSTSISLPDYFTERTRYVLEEEDSLPFFDILDFKKPVLLVHGKRDVMVSEYDIQHLYGLLPKEKQYLEFEKEGHCCNYELPHIRALASEWFLKSESL